MLQLAASVRVKKTQDNGELMAQVTVKNVGPGHGIPTGEPMRSILLVVEARCGEESLQSSGGDVIPDFGGYLEVREGDASWDEWPEASPGDVLRVIRRTGEFLDYAGYGPFGDGTFAPEEKGMPVEEYVGEVVILDVEEGVVTLDGDLPEGDRIYRISPHESPVDGMLATPRAGQPGFGFARVLVGADGELMVPHYLAVDVASDNRLMPQQSWTSSHMFTATCDTPTVTATLLYRSYPYGVATRRGWVLQEQQMTQEVR